MPTPVSIARQCLTQEASHALDEAVAVARRRSHSQTTSLHLISAFLALPSSSLRDACARVKSSAYAPKYQFKALELSFGSALDRLPSSQPQDEPPISNSLMAAIKRSQANQRRNPESFHLYQQQQQLQQNQQIPSSLNCVKVELQNLVLSILDDPIVSRVFAEAGFRSCEVKLAILRPLPPLGRFHRSRRAPLFLCNLTEGDDDLGQGRSNFNFPFMDDSFRRIGEVLGRKKERNPLLIGVSAVDTLRGLPGEVFGLRIFCIEKEVCKFISEGGMDGQLLSMKFEEVEEYFDKCCGAGGIVSFGDLGVLLDDCCVDSVSYVVAQLSRLLEVHREKLWLIGAAAKYEMYLKFLMKFPSIDKDWDLQLLPITSLQSPVGGGFQSRPQSLTESFVPFGGCFSTTSDLRSPLTSTPEPIFRCNLCNEKYEQEVSAFRIGGYSPSVADHCHASLPPWLQKPDLGAYRGLDMTKAKDDGTVFRAKVTGLQNKWNDICRRLHHCSPTSTTENHRVGLHVIPTTMGLPFLTDRKDSANDISVDGKINALLPNESECGNAQPSIGLHKISSPTQRNPLHVASEAKSEKACELNLNDSKSECLRTESHRSPPYPLSGSGVPDDHVSPSSTATVVTDLGLGTLYASTNKEPNKLTGQTHRGWLQESSDCPPAVVDVMKVNIPNSSIQSPSRSDPDHSGQVDPNDLKSLWRGLLHKVGRQNEAMQAISETIVRCRTGSERRRGANLKRDLWFNFTGLDRVAKRRTALALAEILFHSSQNIIRLDLSSQDGMTNTIFGCGEMDRYDVKFRGKMSVDYIVEEVRKKPLSIVLLENINKADRLLQKSLSQAVKTGKLPDSRGRETSISNTIFISTSSVAKETKDLSFEKICTKFSEERVLGAQSLEIQMLIGCVHESSVKINHSNVLVTSRSETPGLSFVNKRKLSNSNDNVEQCEWMERAHKTPKFLDLNLPIEETEAISSDNESSESDTVSESTEMWLEEFLGQMDGTAVFKPFDFDALANRLLKEISVVSRKTLGSDCLLEIDSKVMEQILAAAWLSDRERAVEDWVEHILGKSFVEARQRYSITDQSVLKLVSFDDSYVKEQASGVCLPARIILN